MSTAVIAMANEAIRRLRRAHCFSQDAPSQADHPQGRCLRL